jgi:Neuraminidase (sialidase)
MVAKEATMDWEAVLQASLATIVEAGPQALAQHWNGNGPDGKINNAVQIIQDAAQAGATMKQNLAASQAAQNPHPEIAAAAGQPTS